MKHHCTYVWADNKKMKKKPLSLIYYIQLKFFLISKNVASKYSFE